MQRASDKHSPRVDEAMAHDTRSVVQGAPVEARDREERLQEGGEAAESLADPALEEEARVARSEVARHLRPSAFPGDRDRLLAVAREEHASDAVLDLLALLPADVTFPNVEVVWETLGGQPEQRA